MIKVRSKLHDEIIYFTRTHRLMTYLMRHQDRWNTRMCERSYCAKFLKKDTFPSKLSFLFFSCFICPNFYGRNGVSREFARIIF